MKRLFKWLGIVLAIPLLLVILALVAVVGVAGTEGGVNLVAREAAERVDGLEIAPIAGHLGSGVATEALSFANESLAIEASGVDTAWRLGCLAQRRFCLERAVVEELVIALRAGEESAPAPEREGPIALPEIRLPLDVTLEQVRIGTLRVRPPGDAPEQVLENVLLSARTDDGVVTIENASVDYGTYSAALGGRLTPAGDYPLDLDLVAELDGVIPEGMGAARDIDLRLALDGSVAELELAADVGGAVEATLSGRVEPLAEALPARLELSAPAVGWPLDTREQIAARELVLTLDGTLAGYALALSTTLEGAQLPETALALSGEVNTERLALDAIDVDTLGGGIDGTATLGWTEGIDWSTALAFADLDPSLALEGLAGRLGGEITASGGVDGADWTLDVPSARVEGRLRGQPFSLDARLARGADGVLAIDALTLDNGANRIDAGGTVGERWDLRANARLPELANLWPGLGGALAANLSLSGPLVEPSVSLRASSRELRFEEIVIGGLSLEAEVARAALEPSSLALAVGEATVAGQTVANARLNLDGTRAAHRLELFADGPEATAVALEATGGLTEAFDWNGRLETATLELPAHELVLEEPTALAWTNARKAFAVDPHCWVSEGTRLCLENRVLAAADGRAVVSLDTYALARLNPFLPAETTLSGTLGADAELSWGGDGGFAADATLAIVDGGATVIDAEEEPLTFRYDSLELAAQASPEAVDATLALVSETMGEARVELRLDPAGEEKPIEGQVELDGLELGFLKAFLPQIDEIGGTVSAEGALSGNLADPRFDGAITLAGPRVAAEMLPLAVLGGEIVTNVRGQRAWIEGELLANDEGRIGIDGSANWQQLDAWRADVTLTGEGLVIRQEPLTDSRVGHEVTVSARPGAIRVSGGIDVPYATINVRELPQGAATLSDDIIVVEDLEEALEDPEIDASETAVDPPGELSLLVALEVALGDEVSVDAYGLEANLTGDMSVSLRSPNPVQLGGEIEVVDGIFKQYGQNLEASGQILFVGPVDRTSLDIEAIRRIETEDPERIAGLRITGTVDDPDIELFTEPGDKSEEAILSYIVLGRDIGETSDQEANLLATAALALSVRGGRSIGQNIADTLGIEDFAFETRGQGDDTELVVSGRLNDRLLLRYGQSVFSPEQTLYLRYDLARQLYLEAAQGLSSAVDLFYEFSF